MVTSEHQFERWLHKIVSAMCGRQNTCGNKIDYRSQPSALRAAIQFGKKRGREFDVYNCWFCNGWHIGGAFNLSVRKFFKISWFWVRPRLGR